MVEEKKVRNLSLEPSSEQGDLILLDSDEKCLDEEEASGHNTDTEQSNRSDGENTDIPQLVPTVD